MENARTASIVREHYSRPGLAASILAALKDAGKDIDSLSREDLFTLDEFHIRGREATREMAELAGLKAGMRVLDIGCGIGGPARTLAAEFGCTVFGLDLVEEYALSARELTERVGWEGQAHFVVADATRNPFVDSGFDAVLIQHVTMNVADKSALFADAARALRPGGILADYTICAGESAPIHLPVPWSDDGRASFLIPPVEYRATIEKAGFRIRQIRDVTTLSLDWFRGVLARMAERSSDETDALGPNLIMGESAAAKMKTLTRNLEEDRVKVLQIAAEKSGS